MIFLQDSLGLSAVSLSRQRHDILDFSYCPLSRVLHVTLANRQGFGFGFHLRSSPSAYSGFVNISRPAEYFTALLHRVEETQQGRNSCPRLQFGFQFGRYRVVASLSFLRRISLASFFTSLSIFDWSDLLQILRRQAAFSFAVLCVIMFKYIYSMSRVPYNKLLTNLACSSRIGEYWSSVVFVLSRPRVNIPQHGPRARLVRG